jgi:uncharacterized protein (TIGR02186 family)
VIGRWIMFVLFVALPLPALAAGVVADLSSPTVAVTTGFTGANLIVFGGMDEPGDVVIVAEGPQARATVRRKSRVFGIWINTESFIFDEVPGYYVIASSKPAGELTTPATIDADRLQLDQLRFPIRGGDVARAETFRRALIDRRTSHGFYREMPQGVHILSNRLFRATFPLPANVPIGDYKVHIYLFRDGKIAAEQTLPLSVDETGLSATIFEAAKCYPFLYALAALMLAIVMGGGSAWAFQRVGR